MADNPIAQNNNTIDSWMNKLQQQQSQLAQNGFTTGAGLARAATTPLANTGSTWKNVASNAGAVLGITQNSPVTYQLGATYADSYNNMKNAFGSNWANMSDAAKSAEITKLQSNYTFGTQAGTNTGTIGLADGTKVGDSITSASGQTTTQLNVGGAAQGAAAIAQAGLAIYNAYQNHQALKEAKRQFNEQMKFAKTNANNQVTDTNARRRSSVNIGSSLMGLSKEEAAKRQENSKQYDMKNFE